MQFNGNDHFVYTAAEDIRGSWTASLWVNNSSTAQSTEIILNSPDTSIRVKQLGTGKVGFSRYGAADYSFNYTLAADGTWKQLTFVGDTNGTSLYVNGDFIETHSVKINLPTQSLGKITSSYKGMLDEVKLYDRPLTAAEIRDSYLADIAAKPSIALNKPATADASTLGHEAGLANDADKSNASYWEAELAGLPERTWQVDLQGLYTLDGVKIRTIADGASYVTYVVEASEDGSSWTQIGSRTDTALETDFGRYFVTSAKARFLRVRLTGSSSGTAVQLSDVSVYGKPASIALGKPATAESSEAGHGPELAVDAVPGNGTYWDAALDGNSSRWWQVDLGQLHRIDRIVVRNYVEGSRYYHYEVQASQDGTTWTTVAAKTDSAPADDDGDSYTVNVDARWLRVVMTHNSSNESMHLSDFQAFGYALP